MSDFFGTRKKGRRKTPRELIHQRRKQRQKTAQSKSLDLVTTSDAKIKKFEPENINSLHKNSMNPLSIIASSDTPLTPKNQTKPLTNFVKIDTKPTTDHNKMDEFVIKYSYLTSEEQKEYQEFASNASSIAHQNAKKKRILSKKKTTKGGTPTGKDIDIFCIQNKTKNTKKRSVLHKYGIGIPSRSSLDSFLKPSVSIPVGKKRKKKTRSSIDILPDSYETTVFKNGLLTQSKTKDATFNDFSFNGL